MLPVSRTNALRSIVPDIKVKFFSDEELETIYNYVMKSGNKGKDNYRKRYLLLVKVLLRTGARIEEVVPYDRPERETDNGKKYPEEHFPGLRPKDVNLSLNTISILTLKKGRMRPYRTLPLHPDLKDAIMQYFIEFHIDTKSDQPLIPIRRQSVDEYLTRMEKALGISINAHKFRHTFAVKALLDGVPLNVLQKWLAHSSLVMTSVYADVIGMDTADFMNRIR